MIRQFADVILASGSPRRRELFEREGITFTILKSDIEEETKETDPGKVVLDLSGQKALAVRDIFLKEKEDKKNADTADRRESGRDVLIVSADTIVAKDDLILGKPKDEKDALNILMSLSGQIHSVFTGVNILYLKNENGRYIHKETISFSEETKVKMIPFSEDDAREYIRTGEPMDKAGAYGIQGIGGKFVEKIDGDFDNVVGFPMASFVRKCCEYGCFKLY